MTKKITDSEAIKLARKMYDSGASLKNISEHLKKYGIDWSGIDIQYFTGRGKYDKEMKFPYPRYPYEIIKNGERFVLNFYKKRSYKEIPGTLHSEHEKDILRIPKNIDRIVLSRMTKEQRKIVRTAEKMLGEPDLFLMKDDKIIFVEVKLGRGSLSKEQRRRFKLLSKEFDVFIVYVDYTPKLDIPPRKRFSISKITKF